MLSTGLFSDMQRIADKIKWDVENQLQEAFKTFEVVEDLSPSVQDENNVYYRMKIRTDDNGHVKVKTLQKDPGSDWKVNVEEFDRGNKAIEGGKSKSLEKPDQFIKDMQRISDRIKRDVESQLQSVFKTFDITENRLKIKTDENDQVQVKTLQNTPKSDVNVQVEKFNKGEESLEAPKTKEKKVTPKQDSFFQDIQSMTDRIRSNVESQLQRAFKTFEVLENRMKITTDNNGQVEVKASETEPGKDWKVEVEDYKRGDKPSEAGKEGQQKTAVH